MALKGEEMHLGWVYFLDSLTLYSGLLPWFAVFVLDSTICSQLSFHVRIRQDMLWASDPYNCAAVHVLYKFSLFEGIWTFLFYHVLVAV